jgi:DNA-binding response OmpR family regulator
MLGYPVLMENATPSGPEPRHVLVAADDPAMRVLLGETLEREGFAVTVEETGEAVMATVERTRFDAVVLDGR